MTDQDITIINTSVHKNLTDTHLAQVNFTAYLPDKLWDMYIEKTSFEHESLGRVRFMKLDNQEANLIDRTHVFGRVSHGYGYGIEQDIFNSIIGVK